MATEKNKYTIWMYPETWEKVKELYKEAGCPRKSDFIEQAVRFYVGYMTAENKANFLPKASALFCFRSPSLLLLRYRRQASYC